MASQIDYKRWLLRQAWEQTFRKNREDFDVFGTHIDETTLRNTLDGVGWKPQITGLLLYLLLHMCHTGEAVDAHAVLNKFCEVSPLFHHRTIVFTSVFFELATIDVELYVAQNVCVHKERATLAGVLQHLHRDATITSMNDQVVHAAITHDLFSID